MSREAMQMALEALESDPVSHLGLVHRKMAITALRQALVNADDTSQERVDEIVKDEHEPVAWMYEWDSRKHLTFTDQRFVEQAHPHFNKSTPLYTAPPKQWVGLTDDVVFELADTNLYEGGKNFGVLAFAKAIEQALKEKNT
jgi:hypothetical protein